MPNLNGARRRYAQKLRKRSHLRSKLLVKAFATVPREHYLGPPPWRIMTQESYRSTTNSRDLYDNVLVGIIPQRLLNNGQPSGLARWFDALDLRRNESVVHIGCGTGYYSAILAHVVGPGGSVTSVEVDDELASRAKTNLAHLRQVTVVHGDGNSVVIEKSDAVFINAGANFPRLVWLDALNPGGRLIFPLITMKPFHLTPFTRRAAKIRTGAVWHTRGGYGVMLRVMRTGEQFDAMAISSVGIFPCIGSVERDTDERAAEALKRNDSDSIHSLRRDAHDQDGSCWLHGMDFCISRNVVPKNE
jgi:protein-L-isoaspartate(D-aspartate) O-methyltransferase